MIKIIGAKCKINNVDKILNIVKKFSMEHDLIIQIFNADLIYGKDHIISAINHAKRAFELKTNTTNSLEMEILLYASGERQLKLAIPKMGIKKGDSRIVLVLINDKSGITDDIIQNLISITGLIRDESVIPGDENTLKNFGINENEIKTIMKSKYGDLILEKVAMVDIIK